jgi:holin-like protein
MPVGPSRILRSVNFAVALKIGTQALAGFVIMLLLLDGGRALQAWSHAPLPGAVIGIALLAAGLAALEFWRPRVARRLGTVLNPPSRWLLSHLGLLFVPAGVGIMTQADLLRRQWIPIAVALVGSTLVGLAVTAWLMQKLGPSSPSPSP